MKGMWGLLAGTSLAALAVASPAFAQEEDAEIVVTGSQIRGIAPAGAQVIGLGAEQIEETGAASGNDILSQIPQVSNFFNAMPNVGGNNPFGIGAAPISRPNLRSLPGNNTNSSSFTLVLIDGHRVTPGGLIQPVVALQANGGVRADVRVGQPVEFSAVIETPPGGGSIVAAEWDFSATATVETGENRFAIAEQITPAPRVTLTRRHTFTRPGTYYPALRVHSQRQGDAATPFARIPNLGRVRVVVT